MPPKKSRPYGSWSSPISAWMVAEGGRGSSALPREIHVDGRTIYWLEAQPREAGRSVIMRRDPDGRVERVTPKGYSVRSRVHEYGGGSYCLHGSTIIFSNDDDQRLYLQEASRSPVAITPMPSTPQGLRFADGRVSPDGRWILTVRESHTSEGVVNDLVLIPLAGDAAPRIVHSGHDFYSNPRFSPSGRQVCWLAWDHPRMPWDGTELFQARFEGNALIDVQRIAGGPKESIFQPEWSPKGVLHFVSDRTGWWNLYAAYERGTQPLAPSQAEFGVAQWVFGLSTYTFLPDGSLGCILRQQGQWHLAQLWPETGKIDVRELPFTSYEIPSIKSDADGNVWVFAGSFSEPPGLVRIHFERGEVERCAPAPRDFDPEWISPAETMAFRNQDGDEVFALYYAPTNPEIAPPKDAHPPLLVLGHGGPTSSAPHYLQPEIQYWTSRGIAVVDVDYGGSTGYGRRYRERLKGRWGVLDAADCVEAARTLVREGRAAAEARLIRGSSAGGFLALCVLVFYDEFAGGASYYGVADLEALAQQTHKFEAHYLDQLVAPYPQEVRVYRARSPIHHTGQISCPLILFQGLEDRVVPPAQAEALVRALQTKGIPYAYLAFPGEGHGFRSAETIERCLQAEFAFYGRILGFEPADDLPPVPIQNL